MRLVVFAAIVLAAMSGASAAPDAVGRYGQTCTKPSGVESVRNRSDLPPALRDEFKGVAMPGENWNEGDFGIPGQGLTLIWHRGTRWVVIEGLGGIATRFGVRAFDVNDDGQHFVEITRKDQSSDLCQSATEYIRS
jgi:hypothetical protein